jgi:hypothetical protein
MEDDLTDQALDFVFKSNTLQDRVVNPLKKKLIPALICIGAFNLLILGLLVYIIVRIHT